MLNLMLIVAFISIFPFVIMPLAMYFDPKVFEVAGMILILTNFIFWVYFLIKYVIIGTPLCL